MISTRRSSHDGTGKSFDWSMLKGKKIPLPWMLSGGLSEKNIEEAIRQSGAGIVDVSSSLEREHGMKEPQKIVQFLQIIQQLG